MKKVVRALESVGFQHTRTKGSHAIYRHGDCRSAVVPMPWHRQARDTRIDPQAGRTRRGRVPRTTGLTWSPGDPGDQVS
ncbi:MAG: type II toxin-antitoxin system HicA family toxin [Kibdelosporangium sp.]